MTVREYIGARYVPLFMGEWSETATYEPLSIVTYQGDSYTSRKYVPAGILPTNEEYWALTGNYNAQIEAYRQEVRQYSTTITENTEDIETLQSDVSTLNTSMTTLETNVTSQIESFETSVNQSIQTMDNRIAAIEPNTEMVIIGDSFSVNNNIQTEQFWWYKLAQKLSLTPHNYSVNGCGYKRGTTPFATQIANAAADTSYENSDVELFVMFGSVNDCYASYTTGEYANLVNAAIALARTSFPNAKIVVAGINSSYYACARTGYSLGSVTILTPVQDLEKILSDTCGQFPDVLFIPFARKLVGREDLFSASYNNHPTPNGQTYMANIFYNYLCGGGFAIEKRVFGIAPIYGSGNVGFWFDEYNAGFFAGNCVTEPVSGDYSYCVVPIPYGIDAFLYETLVQIPVGIAARATSVKTNIGWVYPIAYNALPSWSGMGTLPSHSQAALVIGGIEETSTNLRIHSIGTN